MIILEALKGFFDEASSLDVKQSRHEVWAQRCAQLASGVEAEAGIYQLSNNWEALGWANAWANFWRTGTMGHLLEASKCRKRKLQILNRAREAVWGGV